MVREREAGEGADALAREAMRALCALRDNVRQGRSNRLDEVSESLPSALGFEGWYSFLRRNGLVSLSPDATVALTDSGERIAEQEDLGRLEELARLERGTRHEAPRREEARPSLSSGASPATSTTTTSVLSSGRALSWFGAPQAASFARYDLIGEGPLALVYRARHLPLAREVAIKELKNLFDTLTFLKREEVARRLSDALQAQAAVSHPCVVRLVEQWCGAELPSYAMDYCAGGNLRQQMSAQPRPTEAASPSLGEALRLFLQLCHALRAAHAQGLVHGDLKPENVLFDAPAPGQPRNLLLADFGIARVVEVGPMSGLPRLLLGIEGLPYRAPELLLSHKESMTPLPSADVYSAGVLLYELLTGHLPGRRSRPASEEVPGLGAAFDALLERMCEERREERLPDFDAVLEQYYEAAREVLPMERGALLIAGARALPPLQVALESALPLTPPGQESRDSAA